MTNVYHLSTVNKKLNQKTKYITDLRSRDRLPTTICFLKCWLADDRYDINNYENLLKEKFENSWRVFDSSQFCVEAKIAVIATTVSNVFPFVFSSYNEVGNRHFDCAESIGSKKNFKCFLHFCFQVTNIFGRRKLKTRFICEKREFFTSILHIGILINT